MPGPAQWLKDPMLPHVAWIQSLAQELNMPQGAWKKKKLTVETKVITMHYGL